MAATQTTEMFRMLTPEEKVLQKAVDQESQKYLQELRENASALGDWNLVDTGYRHPHYAWFSLHLIVFEANLNTGSPWTIDTNLAIELDRDGLTVKNDLTIKKIIARTSFPRSGKNGEKICDTESSSPVDVARKAFNSGLEKIVPGLTHRLQTGISYEQSYLDFVQTLAEVES